MSGRSFDFSEAVWATVGAVGPPGRRTFYLQARQGVELLTLKLEKQHVAAIGQHMAELLSDLPTVADRPPPEAAELAEPVEPEWPVGTLQLAYDGSADRVLLVATEMGEGDEDDDEDPDLATARIGMTRAHAALIVDAADRLLGAGRPTCPLCGRPIDPEGHACPRTNGHRPTA